MDTVKMPRALRREAGGKMAGPMREAWLLNAPSTHEVASDDAGISRALEAVAVSLP